MCLGGEQNPPRRRVLRMIGWLPAAAVAAGCDLPALNPTPIKLYTLTPKTTFGPDLPKVDWQLLVELPIAAAALNTARIALQQTPLTIEYYANASWTDQAPNLIQNLIIESFESSGRIEAVGMQVIGLRGDFVLMTELREFQAQYFATEKPLIRVGINAKLVKMPERTIVGLHRMERTALAVENSLDDVVMAFDVALGKVLKELVDWTLMTGQEVERGSRHY